MLTPKYRNKILACKNAIALMNGEVASVLDNYEGRRFQGSAVSKRSLFESILQLQIPDAHAKFLEAKCGLLKHHMDRRTELEYAIDLVLGWMIEDAVVEALRKNDVECELVGADKGREFLPQSEIDAGADLLLHLKEGPKHLDVLADWSDTWSRYGHLDLRDNKFNKLLSKKAAIVGIAPLSRKCLFMDLAAHKGEFEQGMIGAYGKPGYTCHSVRSHLVDVQSLASEIKRFQVETSMSPGAREFRAG